MPPIQQGAAHADPITQLLEGLPVLVAFFATLGLPYLLRRMTLLNAVSASVVSPADLPALELLLRWRDIVSAVIMGTFVLEFALAQKISSGGQYSGIALVLMITVVILFLIIGWWMAENLTLAQVNGPWRL